MIKEAATWAAPRSGKAGSADFEGRALRGQRAGFFDTLNFNVSFILRVDGA